VTPAESPRIAVLGAGAVGCYYGGMLARAGTRVTLIARAEHATAINQDGLRLHTLTFDERITVSASTDIARAADADLVLLTVKTLDTESVARALVPHLRQDAVVVSLQNGVDNVDRIRRASGIDAVAAVIYVAVAMSGPGEVRHSGRGDIVVGNLPGQDRGLDPIANVFQQAGVECSISQNILGELWTKLVINCAYNAISALTKSEYAGIVQNPGTRNTLIRAVEETVAVATASGVDLGHDNLVASALALGETMMPRATSSTAQDLARGKRTEIDSLNGYVSRRGSELGIPTLVNTTLHALIKRLEETQA
jgi:2-dehydropantoate 2-reductase